MSANQEAELYLASLKMLHAGLEKAVDGLTVAQMDAVPAAGANSLAAIVAHSMGAERYLIAQLVGGVAIQRDRAAEFATCGKTAAEITGLIRATASLCEPIVAGLPVERMGQDAPHREGPRPVRWCILHSIEHIAEHLGHAGLTRQIVAEPDVA